jgi:hypothetical protein
MACPSLKTVFDASNEYFNISSTNYFTDISRCKTLGDIREISNCTEQAEFRLFQTAINSSHEPFQNCKFLNPFQVNCKYDVQRRFPPVADTIINNLYLTILQYDCQNEIDKIIVGGSNFEVIYDKRDSESDLFMCNVIDLLNSSYHVQCPIHFPIRRRKPNGYHQHGIIKDDIMSRPNKCINITILLDYEHYQAISPCQLLTSEVSFLRHPILPYTEFCTNDMPQSLEYSTQISNKLPSQETSWLSSIKNLISNSGSRDPVEPNVHSYTFYDGMWVKASHSTPISSLQLVSNASTPEARSYVWRWHVPSNTVRYKRIPDVLSSTDIQQCLQSHNIEFIGDSHSRYLWDKLLIQLYGEKTFTLLDNSILGVSMEKIKYRLSRFGPELAKGINYYIDDLEMNSSRVSERFVVVLHTGFWDAYISPLHQFVFSPDSLNAIITALHRLKSSKISNYVTVIWTTTVPLPPFICPFNSSSFICPFGQISFRNNYAIRSMNHHIEISLRQIELPRLRVVRSFDILAPRAQRFPDEVVCNNHYFCRKKGQTIRSTPGGEIMLQSILRAACF